ncbi:MAG: hypothetical protein ACK4WC_16100 [Rubrimonas sp.]
MILRLLSFVLGLLAAAVALATAATVAVDLWETQSRGFVLRQLGEWWVRIDSASLQLTQAALERHVHPWLWDPLMLSLLLTPALYVGAGLALFLWLLARALR